MIIMMVENIQHFPVIDVIVKLGGSAITDKSRFESLKEDQLQRACQYIFKCQEAGLKCLIVHGAGSFGHHQAKQYQVNRGFENPGVPEKDKLWGYVSTRQSVTKLNKLVVDSLIQNGVFAIGCSPGSSWKTKLRKPVKWSANEIADFLNMGLVPVYHGDCCLDESLGCSILSGDTIIESVCSQFEVKRVVFLTDVAGVYDRPPNESGANLLKTIAVNNDGSFQSSIQMSESQYDVTGGIKLKLKTASDILTQSKTECPVYVCGVNSAEAEILCLRNRLKDEDLNATEITFSNCSKDS